MQEKNTRAVLVGAVGLAAVALVALGLSSSAATPQQVGLGKVVSCVTDDASGCTINHGLGVKPDAVTATVGGRAQLVSVPTDQITATSYRVNFNWRDGTTMPRTSFTFNVHIDYTPTSATTPPPTTTSTPPVSTPPVSTPPPTTPTSGTSPVKTCTAGQTFGEGGQAQFGSYYFYLHDWNDSFAGEQYRAMVCASDNWWLEADVPDHSDLSVQAYPAMQRNFSPAANLSTLQTQRFAQNTNAAVTGARWNVAVDAWINQGQSCELMIWTQWQNQTPAGSNVGTVTIGGQSYQVWKNGSTNLSTGACGIVSYRSVNQQTFGSLPVQSFISDMKGRSWLPANNTTWQFNYGVEVVDTNGDGTLGGAGTLRWNFTDDALVTS